MLSPIKRKRSSILGIDLSAGSVKIIELSRHNNRYCIQGFGERALPLHAVEGHVIKDVDVVAECIKQLLFDARFVSRQAVMAVPDSAVMTHRIQIHNDLNEREIEALVIMEAEKYSSLSLLELNIDFKVLGVSSINSRMLDVLIVATRAENVANRILLAKLAGLTMTLVDVETFVVERVMQRLFQCDNQITALFDINIASMHLYILLGMKVIYSREECFDNQEIVSEWVSVHLKKMLQSFSSIHPSHTVNQIILSGEIVCQFEISQSVMSSFDLSTAVLNPLASMAFSEKINQEKAQLKAPSMMMACGLALRHFS